MCDARTLRFSLLLMAFASLAACGGDEGDATGFTVVAKIRGINIAAMSQIQVRFEATGDARFGAKSGDELGIDYETEDDGRAFVATAGRGWVTDHYELSESEFVLKMPFQNPDAGGDVNVHILIHRDVNGDLILVGESALTSTQLPAGAGAEVEVVVGCVDPETLPCGADEVVDPPAE